jgi:L,D-peptidoglycan transpeptidase YkuD (ErfK/YbiS/YcfS/YnhG family)
VGPRFGYSTEKVMSLRERHNLVSWHTERVRLRHIVASTVAFAALGGSVDAGWLDGLGQSRETAERDVAYPTGVTCNLKTVRALAARHPDVRQFVVLVTDSFTDTVGEGYVAARRSSGDWVCQTSPADARFGRTGTRPLLDRRSGDGSTPAGVFPMGAITAWDGQRINVFGNSPDPGVNGKLAYRDVQPEDCWGATPNDADYNHLVNDPGCEGPDDEWLPRFGGVYAHAAIIGANLDPITEETSGDAPGEPPFAAAIFLHRHSYGNGRTSGTARPTSGCVSLPYADLVASITALDPDLNPHFAIGPLDYLVADA